MKRILYALFSLTVCSCNWEIKKECYTCTEKKLYDVPGQAGGRSTTQRKFDVCGKDELMKFQGKMSNETVTISGVQVFISNSTSCVKQ